MFDQVPKYFWEDKTNQRQFFDWAATKLNLKSHSGKAFYIADVTIRLVQCEIR